MVFLFLARQGDGFCALMAEFQSETVLGFKAARKRAFKRKTGRTGRWAVGLCHQECGFLGFLLTLNGCCLLVIVS